MSKTAKLLWMDLEMTGLHARDDLILEVAAIVTDWDFNEIAVYEGVIKNEKNLLAGRLEMNKAFWDVNPQSRDGLLAQNPRGKSMEAIEEELLKFINKNFESDKPVILAGNSIHIDRRFITAQWPKLDDRLHYRMLDVSAWKVVFEGKYKKKFAKPDAHRALEDIRGSIQELKYYLAKLK